MRRGFKAEAKRLSLELRDELGMDAHCPFDPYALAALYGIEVINLSDLECDPKAKTHFSEPDRAVFSGALIPIGSRTVILENDTHPRVRRRSTVSHEMSHVVLEHPFGVSLTDERKCGLGGDQEEEADWLYGELLIPMDGAVRLAGLSATDEDAALAFDVSLAVARWRMNHSGARRIVANARKKHSGRA